jgi:Spy/CpxP family protein refolding chaperone
MAAGMAFAQAPAAPAQPAPGKAWNGRRGAVRRHMMQALNLTDVQKAQAKALFQQARETAKPLAQQLKDTREAMSAAVKANDVAQIQHLAAQQGNLQGQLAAIRSEAMAKFYTNLTPEQRAKADQVQQRVRQRMQQRLQNRRNG